jgi:hypothetical protein
VLDYSPKVTWYPPPVITPITQEEEEEPYEMVGVAVVPVRYRPGPCQTCAARDPGCCWCCCCWPWEAEAFSWSFPAWPLQRQTQQILDHCHGPSYAMVLVVTFGTFLPWAPLRMMQVVVVGPGHPVAAAADANPYPSVQAWMNLVHYCCCCCCCCCCWAPAVVPVGEDGMDPW